MRKEIRTNKMTKRAMALILTMSMVCGLAFTVYAGEETAENAEIAAVEATEATASTETPAGEEATVENSGAAELIDAAEAAVIADGLAVAGEGEVVVLQVGQDILEQLQTGEVAVDGAASDLANAKAAMEAAVAADQAVAENTAVVEAYNDAVAASETAAQEAVDQAAIANDANSDEATAKAAAQAANTALTTSEEKLQDAENKYNAAQAAWEEADRQQQEAAAQVAAAETALENAKTNSAAALAALNAAKAQVAALENRKADLEKIQEQYYKAMIHYYRDPKINSAVYVNHKFNLEASEQKALDDGKAYDPTYLNENTLKLYRELMRELVEYKLIANGADPSTIQFAIQEDGLKLKEAATGRYELDNSKNEKVVIDQNTEDQYWTNINDNQSGRHNHVKVTYTDKNGQTQTENYNYIFKASKYLDTTDLTSGPIYLALVSDSKVNNKTVWTSEKDNDANVYDDYQKLNAAIEALQNYEATKAAVDAAEAKVAALKDQAAALNNVTANAQVAAALADLDDAKAAYAAAKAAVEAIDLSRFAVIPAAAADDDTEDETTGGAATLPIVTSITAPVVVTPIAPLASFAAATAPAATPAAVAAPAAGDATAPAAGEGIVELEDEILPGAATVEEEILPAADAKAPVAITNLTDEELPAAGFPGTVANYWWLWLLLVLVAILIYTIYKYNKSKNEAE